MIVDSSAIVAILRDEPERVVFQTLIEAAEQVRMSAPTLLEASQVLCGRFGAEMIGVLDAFVQTVPVHIVPFTESHAVIALKAFMKFGKGRHPAALNFGDCISYATARFEQMPLLFKGNDFYRTDIEPAVPQAAETS